ncbi:XRE family transcriptional regulator [Clostridium botulinum]|uniref:XRE family transcriptional regulator n=1 Tax=Clostridium botulinum TaxID=1491 RepID=A0A6M0SNW5_CLOBO|nr:XRE family transcriptional regulator [Clostridium botulinum]
MIGLEYVLKLFEMTQQELAQKLGIKQQNIDLWIRDKNRSIPNKHLPKLSDIFNIPEKYFQKELDSKDKEKIQMMKLYETNDEEKLGYKKIDKIIESEKWNLGECEYEFEEEMKTSLLEYNSSKEELLNNIHKILDLGIGTANYTPTAYILKISSRELYLQQIEMFIDIVKKSSNIERQIIGDILMIFQTYLIFGYKKKEYSKKQMKNEAMDMIVKNQVNFNNKLMDLIMDYKNVLLEQNIQLGKEVENNILKNKDLNDLFK